MMNGLAIGLLLTTLATAGLLSPIPEKHKQDVIVKEGHRSVMVEYETDGGSNTKVLISPEEGRDLNLGIKEKLSQKAEDVKEKLKESVFSDHEEENKERISHRATPRELVCDAFGKCKHKLANAFGKTKEKAHELEEAAKEAVGEFKGKVSETASEAKEKVKETMSEISEKTHEAKEKAEQFRGGAKEKLKDGKEKAARKAEELKEEAKERLKRGDEDVIDSTNKVKEEIKNNGSEMMEEMKGKGKEAEEKFKNETYNLKEEGKKEMNEILHRGGEVIHDAFMYMISSESLSSGIRIMDLFGFSMAFGMAMWVTFISSYVLAGALPRQQFAMVQSKIYPVYFRAMAFSVGMVVVADFLSWRKMSGVSPAEMLQGFSLVGCLLMVLANLWYLEPRATKVMFERMKLEKEEMRGIGSATAEPATKVPDRATDSVTTQATTMGTATVPSMTMASATTQERADGATAGAELVRLSEQLKRLNSLSSYLNILTLMCLAWRLVHLGQRLQVVC